ncbi:Flp pilus assembly protein TadG [Porphyrobacter sp. MBR-155]|jgi:Flp pilus assembly protein TadG|uniref:pilus assembly protein TadG-related protein n=1 Tax=Porphyrobacter sp. MBR-155 TaxID=3156464 RepID=UPI0033933B2C
MIAKRLFIDFAKARDAAIAPLYALALFGLIMIAGVGWDYSRMATMDSELQNAADQAALAAATQLTGVTGARANATAAATNFLATAGSAWANETKLANDEGGRTVGGLTFEFFQSWNHATDVPGPAATTDANARYVRVTVGGREAFYALTAIGGLASSGLMGASAVATLEASACNVPPLMVCAPTGNSGWPTASDIGSAVDMREGPQNAENFTPGNFDLLDIDYDSLSQNEQNRTLGLNSDLLGCTGEQITTEPGRRVPQNTAINTRFGIYPNGNNFACRANGDFCPGDVTRNDLVRQVTVNGNGNNATCENTAGGDLIPFTDIPGGAVPKQGFPLDTCQTLGLAGCLSFGDGAWPVDTYLNDIHGTTSASIPGLDADGNGKISRFEVYQWERQVASRTAPRELARVNTTSPTRTTLYCSAPRPIEGTPVVPSPTQKDRRILTVAVVDCAGQGGRFDVNTFRFVDMFLLGPMTGQTGSSELKAEIMGPARRADGGSGFQNFGRKKPVLVQ